MRKRYDAQLARWKSLRRVETYADLEEMLKSEVTVLEMQEPVLQAIMKHRSSISHNRSQRLKMFCCSSLQVKSVSSAITIATGLLTLLQDHRVQRHQKAGFHLSNGS